MGTDRVGTAESVSQVGFGLVVRGEWGRENRAFWVGVGKVKLSGLPKVIEPDQVVGQCGQGKLDRDFG